jgi:4-diphosphocytidyl-2-C-methyl-D-erythritol kinase
VQEVRVRVPAKVNLHLSVGPLRPDGYHELVTVFHAVELFDDVTAHPSDGLSIDVSGSDEVPADERNLAWQAAELLAETAGRSPDVHLVIEKHIPVAGGMAGGSADAAGALRACAALWGVDTDLPKLAAQLGADVAFALLGGTAVGTGRGEILTPVTVGTQLHWVFAAADYGISTADAYRELDRLRETGAGPPPIGAPDDLLQALRTGDLAAIAANLGNDLEAAALSLRPELQATLDSGREAGALAAIVSGSGPTCAFLCENLAARSSIAAAVGGSAMG